MRRLAIPLVAVAVAAAAAVGGARPSRAGRADWTGSEACGSCHPAQLEAWRRTAHARAGARPGARASGRCLGCHATGEAPAGPAIELAVGCEACHGAGAAYAADDVMRDPGLARALGLRDLSTDAARQAVCASCHRGAGTRLTPPALAVTPEAVH